MKNYVIFFLSIAVNFIANNATAQSGCIEIESILVNACSAEEGRNEMLRFRVGGTALSTNNMTVAWANTNLPYNGLIQNSTTAQATAAFNSEIVSCGQLIEPVNGVLPAYAQVLLITSYQVSTTPGFFAQLGDTLYVLYANDNTVSGHFLNYVPNASPDIQTSIISFSNIPGCSDQVSYFRTQLITQTGGIGDEDGARVDFNVAGTPTYVNIGCNAPYTPFSATWTIPSVCSNSQAIDLNLLVTGSSGGTWSGPGVTGHFLNPAGLSGTISITYTVGITGCTAQLTQSVPIFTNGLATWTPPPVICNYAGVVDFSQFITGTPGGTFSGQGIAGNIFTPYFMNGNYTFTYTVGGAGCSSTESHVILLQGIVANWTSPVTICKSLGTYNLAPLSGLSTPGTWSGQGVVGTTLNLAGLSGPVSITYTATLNGCVKTNTQSINVDPGPNASWTNPGVFCNSAAPVDLNSLVTGQTGGTWSGTGVTGNFFNPALVSGSATVTYTVQGTTCSGTSSNVLLVGAIPAPTISGPSLICSSNNLATLTVDSIPGAATTWYTDAALTTVAGYGISISPSLSINQTYYVVQNAGSCVSNASSRTVTIFQAPNPPSTSQVVNVCSNDPLPLLTATSSDSIFWFANQSLQNLLVQNANYQPTQTNTSFWVVTRNGICYSTPVQVQLNSTPISAAWTSQAICTDANPLNLNSLITGTSGGTWSGQGVTGSSFNPAGISGSVDITYNASVGNCSASQTQSITLVNASFATWNAPAVICASSTSVDLNQYLSGTSGGTWSGPGLTGSLLNPLLAVGTNSFTYSVGPLGCSDSETHVINVQQLTANWTSPGTICESASIIDLSTLLGNSSPGSWSGQGVTGTSFDPNGLNGDIAITYTAELNGCSLVNTQIITVNQGPSASWTNPGFVCNSSAIINLDALITGQTGGTWSGNGVIGNTFDPSLVNASSTITYTVNGTVCNGVRSHIIYVGTLPTPTIIGDDSYCNSALTANLQADSIPGSLVHWYADAALTTEIGIGSNFSTALTSSTTLYAVSISGSCESSVGTFSLNVVAAPSTPVTSSLVEVCENTPIPVLTATSSDLIFWYADASLQTLLSQSASYQPTATGISLWVVANNSACNSNSIEVQLVSLNNATVQITTSGSLDLCNGSTVTLTATSTLPVTWSNGIQTTDITVSEGGSYTVSATNSCNTATDQVTVNDLNPNTSFGVNSENGYSPFTLVVSPASSSSCSWFVNDIPTSLTALNQIILESAGTYSIKQVCDNGGCMDSTSRDITVEIGIFTLDLPNSFTPNGDGYNDYFKAKASGIVEFRSSIFDRWGQEVFQWEGASNSWDGTRDGKPVPDGVYFYVIQGKDYTSADFERYGSITLLRN